MSYRLPSGETVYYNKKENKKPTTIYLFYKIDINGLGHTGYCSGSEANTPYTDNKLEYINLGELPAHYSFLRDISNYIDIYGNIQTDYLNNKLGYHNNISRHCGSGYGCKSYETGTIVEAWFAYQYPNNKTDKTNTTAVEELSNDLNRIMSI